MTAFTGKWLALYDAHKRYPCGDVMNNDHNSNLERIFPLVTNIFEPATLTHNLQLQLPATKPLLQSGDLQ